MTFCGYLANAPQDYQGHEEQRKMEKLSQKGDGETQQLNAMWYLDWTPE